MLTHDNNKDNNDNNNKSNRICVNSVQGSCAGLEFKASLEKSLNFRKLKMALNCFGKRMEGLEKFGICLS